MADQRIVGDRRAGLTPPPANSGQARETTQGAQTAEQADDEGSFRPSSRFCTLRRPRAPTTGPAAARCGPASQTDATSATGSLRLSSLRSQSASRDSLAGQMLMLRMIDPSRVFSTELLQTRRLQNPFPLARWRASSLVGLGAVGDVGDSCNRNPERVSTT